MTSKRKKLSNEKIDRDKLYSVEEALSLVKEFAVSKFDESIDVSINLGVDPKQSDQVVRGSTVLPNGTGKIIRVAVFAQGENAEKAKSAGADIVGFEDLAEKIKAGEMNFEVLTNELANVGLTILCVIVGVMIVNWLDRNVFNKNKWRNKND